MLRLKDIVLHFALVPIAALAFFSTSNAQAKLCIHIDSYHEGYAWSDGIEKGIRAKLQGICDVETIRMDTKHHSSALYAKEKGDEIAKTIEQKHPDVVIVSDDPATNWVLSKHFKNSKTPFVFCGVNWSMAQYGMPYKNTTGMLEVVPIEAVIKEVRKVMPSLKTVGFLSVDNETERKEFPNIKKAFESHGIKVQSYWAKSFSDWKTAYKFAQDNDLVYFNNEVGLKGWDKDEAIKFVEENTKKLSVSPQVWDVPYVTFSIAKVAEEQGQWAGSAAAKILKGASPSSIPVVKNKEFNLYVNKAMLAKSPVKLDAEFISKAQSL